MLLPAGAPANEVSESASFAPLITTVGGAPLLRVLPVRMRDGEAAALLG
jgi:hypothetical protein